MTNLSPVLDPEIRPIQLNDMDDVAALYCAVFNMPPWNDAWTECTAATRLTDTLSTPGALGFLAWYEGRLVGGVVGYQEQWFDGVHFYLKEMFVHPAMQRRGIGTHLIRHLTHTLRQDGIRQIYLLTERAGSAADFYGVQGFSVSRRMALMTRPLDQA